MTFREKSNQSLIKRLKKLSWLKLNKKNKKKVTADEK